MTLIPTVRRWAPRILSGALLAMLAAPAVAAGPPVTPTGLGLAVDLAGHRLTMPLPVWTVPSEEPIEQAQTLYNQLRPGVDSLVLFPIGESVVTWNRLMGVLAVNQPGYKGETQLASIVEPMSAVCVPSQLFTTNFPPDRPGGAAAVLLMCDRYKLSASGVPQKCGGGAILATVLESPLGAAKIYHEWCTSSFNVENRDAWPVTPDELSRNAALLKAVSSFVPLPAATPAD